MRSTCASKSSPMLRQCNLEKVRRKEPTVSTRPPKSSAISARPQAMLVNRRPAPIGVYSMKVASLSRNRSSDDPECSVLMRLFVWISDSCAWDEEKRTSERDLMEPPPVCYCLSVQSNLNTRSVPGDWPLANPAAILFSCAFCLTARL